jgi:hypothetical protein
MRLRIARAPSHCAAAVLHSVGCSAVTSSTRGVVRTHDTAPEPLLLPVPPMPLKAVPMLVLAAPSSYAGEGGGDGMDAYAGACTAPRAEAFVDASAAAVAAAAGASSYKVASRDADRRASAPGGTHGGAAVAFTASSAASSCAYAGAPWPLTGTGQLRSECSHEACTKMTMAAIVAKHQPAPELPPAEA